MPLAALVLVLKVFGAAKCPALLVRVLAAQVNRGRLRGVAFLVILRAVEFVVVTGIVVESRLAPGSHSRRSCRETG
jgi:hypothetical protein